MGIFVSVSVGLFFTSVISHFNLVLSSCLHFTTDIDLNSIVNNDTDTQSTSKGLVRGVCSNKGTTNVYCGFYYSRATKSLVTGI